MKIRVTKANKRTYWYASKIGETFNAEFYPERSKYRVEDCRDGTDDVGYVDTDDCEIVKEALSSRPATEQRDEIIANLAQRVSALESEMAELKRPTTRPSVVAEQIAEGLAKLAGGKRKEAPLTRDDVIERAKADVAELIRIGTDTNAMLDDSRYFYGKYYAVKFVVNRDKRTVVALVDGQRRVGTSLGEPLKRGKSRCAPDDVFNVSIGKAIAIRRALGLAVPAEYTEAPKPTEVRVGDIVFYTEMYPRLLVTESSTNCYFNPPTVGIDFLRANGKPVIIDDSGADV